MLSFVQQRRLFWILLTLIVLLFSAAVYSVKQTETPAYTQNQNENAQAGQKSEPRETRWQWLTKDAASFFTFVLALLTAVLAAVGVVQVFFLVRADKTARLAANASMEAAKAALLQARVAEQTLIGLERPYLFESISNIKRDGISISAQILFKNHGKVPAVIHAYATRIFSVDFRVDRSPQSLIYQYQNHVSEQRHVMDSGSSFQVDDVGAIWTTFDDPNAYKEHFNIITDNWRRYFIVGRVVYSAPFADRAFETCFAFRLAGRRDKATAKLENIRNPEEGRAYNYRS